MTKSSLVSYIQKYHLGGMVESVKWTLNNGLAKVDFISTINSTTGHVIFPFLDIKESDQSFGVYSTSSLLKMLSVMSDNIDITLVKEHGVFMSMNIEDSIYQGTYSLADIGSIEKTPKIEEPSVYDVSFIIDKNFIDQYLKAYKALGSINRFTIQAGKEIKITLGNKESYANKISFTTTSPDYLPLKPKSFSGEAVAEILKNMNADSNAVLYVSSEGLLKIHYSNKSELSVVYFIIELEEL